VGGGVRWKRLIDETPVIGVTFNDIPTVYPLKVLEKVEVVNDLVGERPLLVVFTPFIPTEQAVGLFDPVVDGQRITMGSSGYFLDRKPVLYDRGSESFWVVKADGVVSLAGKYKGKVLKQIQHMVPVLWGEWSSQHPKSRLVIGADRSKPRPRV